MHLSLSIITSSILCLGVSNKNEQTHWVQQDLKLYNDLPLGKLSYIPMMQARRMSKATSLACESFLSLLNEQSIDAAVFLSEHGELERSHKILDAINQNKSISPTDFSMSVHNVAAGLSTILSQKNIEVSSISAGQDGLFQALFEIKVLLESGAKNVLLVAFDGNIPEFYYDYGIQNEPLYAMTMLFEKGNDWLIQLNNIPMTEIMAVPLPIQLAHAYLSKNKNFTLQGVNLSSTWECNV